MTESNGKKYGGTRHVPSMTTDPITPRLSGCDWCERIHDQLRFCMVSTMEKQKETNRKATAAATPGCCAEIF